MEFGQARGFVGCEALFGGRDGRAGGDGRAEGRHDGGDDVVDGGGDAQAVQADDVALREGVVGVVDEVGRVVGEVLLGICVLDCVRGSSYFDFVACE